ncbi:MAG TPA: glutathione S-transferase [Burkholderiaceae bacterium]
MYTLFYAPGAASMAVHQALIETGAPYDLQLVDFKIEAQRTPRYLALNPQGTVPTLVIDGKPMAEALALLIALSERHPEAHLAPPDGTFEHRQWLQWLAYISFNLGATFRLWFYPRDLGAEEHSAQTQDALRLRIEGVWDHLERHLAAHGPYLLGAQFSSADLFLTMYMRWSRRMPRTALDWPALGRLAGLVKARPSWQAMSDKEGLSGW